jgi:hypothetical protein
MVAAAAIAVGFALWVGTAAAQMPYPGHAAMHGMRHGPHGMGGGHMMGPLGMLTRHDADSAADMRLVHQLLMSHFKIERTVTNLTDGIKTTTESADPAVAQAIQRHVANMSQRLRDGREFNIFSTTLPVLFENGEKIRSTVELTEKGAVVTRTSSDAKVVAALQAHAAEVTELVNEGMIAMRRGMMSRMAMSHGRAGAGTQDGPSRHQMPNHSDH